MGTLSLHRTALPAPLSFPSTFKLCSSVADCAYEIVCQFLCSHAHYRPKPNGSPRADYLYPVRVHTSAAYATRCNTDFAVVAQLEFLITFAAANLRRK